LNSFRKELNLQRNTKSGEGKRKKRKYLFFDQLLFLLPTLPERQTGGNYASPQAYSTEVVDEEEGYTDVRITESQKGGPGDSNFTFPIPTNERRKERKKAKNPTYEESLLQILKDSKREEID
jgi:hypothetical protein